MTTAQLENSINYPFAHNIETIVVFMILVFTYISLAVFFSVLILRVRKTKFQKKADALKESLNGLIMSAAFASSEEELTEIITQAKPEFVNKIKGLGLAQVMINEVLSIHRNLTGQSKHNLSRLFQETILMNYTLRNLKNENWHLKATAIRDLSQINAEAYIPKIEKYAIHHNIYLQQVAQIALVNLKGYDGLEFLAKLKNALSDWQQINLLDILRKLDKDKAPDFSQWLTHKEDTIKLFSIRLINFFQQSYNAEKVEALTTYENVKVKSEAIITLDRLRPGHLRHSNPVTL